MPAPTLRFLQVRFGRGEITAGYAASILWLAAEESHRTRGTAPPPPAADICAGILLHWPHLIQKGFHQ